MLFPEYIHQNLGNTMRRRFITAFIAISDMEERKENISYYNRVLNYVEDSHQDNRKEIGLWLKDEWVARTIKEMKQNPLVAKIELRTALNNLQGYVKYKGSLPTVSDRWRKGSKRKMPKYSKWSKISSISGGFTDEWKTIFNNIIENVPLKK